MVQLRAAIYCRVSTSDQSCDRQRRDLMEYAARADYQLVGIFEEQASGAKCDRTQRNLVMDLVQARQVDVVLCTELSRWGRSTSDVVSTVEALSGRGASLICLKGLDFDLATAHGKFILSLFAGLTQFERDLLRERVKSGLDAAKARGQQLGRPCGRSPKTATQQPLVLSLHRQGLSVRAIARAVKLSPSTVQRLIQSCSSTPAA